MADTVLSDTALPGSSSNRTAVAAQRPQRGVMAHTNGKPRDPELVRILGLSVPVTATLAEREMNIEAILGISVGTIVEFDVPADAELVLYVANHAIGRGETVKSGENFGVRITQIDGVEQRIDAMAGHEGNT